MEYWRNIGDIGNYYSISRKLVFCLESILVLLNLRKFKCVKKYILLWLICHK